MSEITLRTSENSIVLRVSRVGGSPVFAKTGITITAGEATQIDTGQSSVKPKFITLYDENGKRIDKNMGEPTVTLSTNYIVTYAALPISQSNVTMYYQ